MTDHADAGAPLLIGTQGWKQFLTSKKEMLDAFDGAKEKARAHLVQTSHGNVAEEEFRKWLSGFLPKKYAVTAGYIVSQGVGDEILLPHFEVVIYDQLESPVLWVESDSGLPLEKRPRAVPAEHVRAVLEVKSSLEASSALDALRHLDHLAPLLAGADPPNERYKKYLPPNFLSGVVFFELRKKHEFSRAALNNLVPRKGDPRVFRRHRLERRRSRSRQIWKNLDAEVENSPSIYSGKAKGKRISSPRCSNSGF